MARGRPSKFKPEFVGQAAKLAALGATDREVAGFFEVNEATLNRWKLEHDDFCESLKTGKATADERVERSLYNRAVGYSFDSEKIFHFQGQVTRAPCVEHVSPDVTACIFWLKNRRPEQWREKGEGGGSDALVEAVGKLIDKLPN
jgi:hypothetical protein